MARSINGIGTALYGYGAAVSWSDSRVLKHASMADHDAVECAVFAFLPVFPLRAFHTWDWDLKGSEHLAIPIRPTRRLIARAMLRVWFGVSLPVTLLVGIGDVSCLVRNGVLPGGEQLVWDCFMLAVCFLSTLGLALARRGNHRDRDIRLVLGQHELGSSDPAMWTEDVLQKVESPRGLFGTDSLLEGTRQALQRKNFALAMLGARLSVARGEAQGEVLTDDILSHPDVLEKLPRLRKKPTLRARLFPEDTVPPYLVTANATKRGEQHPKLVPVPLKR